MPSKILFVCLGNICRSPAAEGVFRTLMPEAETDSAGTSGWHENEPPYPAMQSAARKRGVDISDLRARRFLAADFNRFDLIVGMDADTLAAIEAQRPSGNATPVRLLTEFAPETGAEVTAGYEFDVPVRFDTDRIQTSVASFQAGDVPNVPVVEVRV